MVELMPVQIHFTDGTTLRCNYNRFFDVEGFGRCPVDELVKGDVIMNGIRYREWRTVESVDMGKEKAVGLLAQTRTAEERFQHKYSTKEAVCK